MTCGEIHSWTFSGLVGAFLDLGIAYLLLCASTLAYLASKFLGLFGLCLPCPCKGLFWNPCGDMADDPNSQSNTESVDKRNRDNRHVEMDGEASCSSLLQGAQDNVGRELEEPLKEEGFDFKRKGAAGQRKRLGLRRRHRGRVVDNGNSWAGSSYDHSSLDAKESSQTPSNGWEAPVPVDICLQGGVSQCPDLNESVYDFRCNTQMELRFDSNDKNTIRILEQSLEEENAAQIAAATAADEAMAMILRLQEEKALIEMEAKQFHRMIEEKYAYDAEEMNILKEILLRREREKHFLEKEVEAYRQMIEDPMLMLQQISKSIQDKENLKTTSSSREYEGFDLHVRSVNPVEEGQEQSDNVSLAQSVATKTIKSCDEDKTVSAYNGNCVEMDGNQEVKVSQSSVCETESRVYDVHVIDDESSMINEASEKKSGSLPQIFGFSYARNSMSAFDVQRHSMSSFDNERLKIDNEVEWLQERLRIVQEGRGKLNFSLGNKEREKSSCNFWRI
ncbi:hypothetical protein I3843_01G112100 [Carya illinoinensis]|nr:hypothetical protein I3843_01G112100 [Carya illinoinensis]